MRAKIRFFNGYDPIDIYVILLSFVGNADTDITWVDDNEARLSPQGRFHLYISVLVWGFGNFVFNYFYLFRNEGISIISVDLSTDMVAYYMIAFALLATGVSYTIILMTVCLATSNLSHQMSDQIHAFLNTRMRGRR